MTTVVRLNDVCYHREAFTSQGISHYDLFFEVAILSIYFPSSHVLKVFFGEQDCTSPPPQVVIDFCRIVEASKGLVAVHCMAGKNSDMKFAAFDRFLRI